MGREAHGPCQIGPLTEPVKAHLESTSLVLRGVSIRRQFDVTALKRVKVEGDALHFDAAGEAVTLHLGAAEAARWLKKIHTPVPTLAAKLGVSAELPAAVFGALDDAALAAALQGATTADLQAAQVLVALVLTADDLDRAVALHARMTCRQAWFVNVKGKSAVLGDTAIRETLRASGYKDNKTTAVSERFSATRYGKP